MKSSIFFPVSVVAISASCLLFFSSAMASAVEVEQLGETFEYWEAPPRPSPSGNDLPAGWIVALQDDGAVVEGGPETLAMIEQDFEVQSTGDTSVRVTVPESLPMFGLIRWDVHVEPDATYRFSVQVKGRDVVPDFMDQRSGPMVLIESGPVHGLFTEKVGHSEHLDVAGDFDWTPLETMISTRPGDERMLLRILFNNATGTVWFDDLKVERVD